MKSCADANKVKGADKKTPMELRKAISKQCKQADADLPDKSCKVNQKTGKCRDAVAASKKRALMLRSAVPK
jgi:hypothetical protein